jgi:hypothetical protein
MFPLKTLWTIPILWAVFSCNSQNSEITSMDFLKAGDSLSQKTFDTLSRSLQKAIGEGSFENAIMACKEMAPGLTGTYDNRSTTIGRTGMRVRNAANEPDALEKPQLEYFQKLFEEGQPLKPKLVADEKGMVHYFKPILLQPLCLNCHGNEVVDISPAVLAMLKKEYPEDKATGFAAGDLRGMWHITFNPFETKK